MEFKVEVRFLIGIEPKFLLGELGQEAELEAEDIHLRIEIEMKDLYSQNSAVLNSYSKLGLYLWLQVSFFNAMLKAYSVTVAEGHTSTRLILYIKKIIFIVLCCVSIIASYLRFFLWRYIAQESHCMLYPSVKTSSDFLEQPCI